VRVIENFAASTGEAHSTLENFYQLYVFIYVSLLFSIDCTSLVQGLSVKTI